MIPTQIDNNPVHVLMVNNPKNLFTWANDKKESFTSALFVADDGTEMMVPDFCFDKNGDLLPHKRESQAVAVRDEWIVKQLCNVADVTEKNEGKPFNIYVVQVSARPNHVGIFCTPKNMKLKEGPQ